MPAEVILPRVDMDMTAGKIGKWFVEPGAQVTKGQPLIEFDPSEMDADRNAARHALSVDLADTATAERFIDGCTLWVHATSLGGVESTFERRRRWSGELDVVPEGLVRMSVGVEHVEDLWTDLEHALYRL